MSLKQTKWWLAIGLLIMGWVLPNHGFAATEIELSLDKSSFSPGESPPALSISAFNDFGPIAVDVHVGVISPAGTYYEYPDWNTNLIPVLKGYDLPHNFTLPTTPVTTLPTWLWSGSWTAFAALTHPGTINIISFDLEAFNVLDEPSKGWPIENEGYNPTVRNGDRFRYDTHTINTYNSQQEYITDTTIYQWYYEENIQGYDPGVLSGYTSMDGFNINPISVGYFKQTDNFFLLYKSVTLSGDLKNCEIIYEPYLKTFRDMTPGQEYFTSYTVINYCKNEQITNNLEEIHKNIQITSLRNHFDYYPDCLKFDTIYNPGKSTETTVTSWYAKGIGLVRTESSGEGWTTITDTKTTKY